MATKVPTWLSKAIFTKSLIFKNCKAFSWTGTKFYPEGSDDDPFPREYFKNTTCFFYKNGKYTNKSKRNINPLGDKEKISGIKSKCLREYKHKDQKKSSRWKYFY